MTTGFTNDKARVFEGKRDLEICVKPRDGTRDRFDCYATK